jgi:hypothetical protein
MTIMFSKRKQLQNFEVASFPQEIELYLSLIFTCQGLSVIPRCSQPDE